MYFEKVTLVAIMFGLVSHAAWNNEAREPFHYTFSNDKTLDVDDISGTIQIVGDGGNTIRVEGEKIIRAVSPQELERAKKEVTLDVNEKDRVAQLYVNGPFRHGRYEDNDEHGYEVAYNFTVHVPRDTELRLRSVNGEIRTEQIGGKFDIAGVNGAVIMTSAAGSGNARTVNGGLTVSFRENPKAALDLKTVNGAIDAAFPPGLAADLSLKTLNGPVFTDFETAALGQPAERRDGKFVFTQNRHTNVHIGADGPELKFETVNGEIRIRKEASK